MMSLLELAEQCEAATANEQAELLEEAFRLIDPPPSRGTKWHERFDRFEQMLLAEAYESAAMTLVPEGWRKYVVDADNGDAICELGNPDEDEADVGVRAKTWPLALCAAALRARAANTGSDKESKHG